jgi:hypothetical protein
VLKIYEHFVADGNSGVKDCVAVVVGELPSFLKKCENDNGG